MDRHATVLATLCTLWGGLSILVGVSLLFLSGGAMAVLISPDGDAVSFAAGLTAAVMAGVGFSALIWGGAHLQASILLRRRRASGRMLTIGLAVVDILVLPFGTALGAYALWVLLNNEGRRLFEPSHPAHA